jgi:hypothetical protein
MVQNQQRQDIIPQYKLRQQSCKQEQVLWTWRLLAWSVSRTYQKKSSETNKKTMAEYMDMMKEELFRQTIRQKMGNSLI